MTKPFQLIVQIENTNLSCHSRVENKIMSEAQRKTHYHFDFKTEEDS